MSGFGDTVGVEIPEQLKLDNPGAQIAMIYDVDSDSLEWAVIAVPEGGGASSFPDLTDVADDLAPDEWGIVYWDGTQWTTWDLISVLQQVLNALNQGWGNLGWVDVDNSMSPNAGESIIWDDDNSVWTNGVPDPKPPFVTPTSGDYSTNQHEVVLVDATSGPINVSLDATGAVAGTEIVVKKVDASVNSVTVNTVGAETIDGANTYVITVQYESVTIVFDGTNWWVI